MMDGNSEDTGSDLDLHASLVARRSWMDNMTHWCMIYHDPSLGRAISQIFCSLFRSGLAFHAHSIEMRTRL